MSASNAPEAETPKRRRPPRARVKTATNGAAAHPEAAAAPEPSVNSVRHAAEVAHAVEGRVRLKIPAARTNPDVLARIAADFRTMPGIDSIEIRPDSGSLIVYYDADHHPELGSLFATMHQGDAEPIAVRHPAAPLHEHRKVPKNKIEDQIQSIQDEAEFLAEHSAVAKSVVEAVKQLDRSLKRATNNNIDLKITVPLALAAVTFLEIGAAAATPMWVTLAIFSMNHFVELHAHDADEQA